MMLNGWMKPVLSRHKVDFCSLVGEHEFGLTEMIYEAVDAVLGNPRYSSRHRQANEK